MTTVLVGSVGEVMAEVHRMDEEREALLRRVIAWRKEQEVKKAASAAAAKKIARVKEAVDRLEIHHEFRALAWYLNALL